LRNSSDCWPRSIVSVIAATSGASFAIWQIGLAALTTGESADQLTERADAAMLAVKARHHARR